MKKRFSLELLDTGVNPGAQTPHYEMVLIRDVTRPGIDNYPIGVAHIDTFYDPNDREIYEALILSEDLIITVNVEITPEEIENEVDD